MQTNITIEYRKEPVILMNKPLEGIRVIELGTHVAVPQAARMMADWGAEVIKVEPPNGEPWRQIGKAYGIPCDIDHNPMFQPPNANKKSIAIDLKSAEGKDVMLKLLETADVFMTNTRGKALDKLGMNYEALKDKFPKLIYFHFTSFGPKGPDKDRPGFDNAAFWSRGGMPLEWTCKGSVPFKPQPGFGDGTVASNILAGILAALLKKEKTGQGEKLETSLYAGALWFNGCGIVASQPRYGHLYPKERHDEIIPASPLFQTKDGDWLLVAMPDWDQKYAGLLKTLHLEQYIGDPRFATLKGAQPYIKELVDILDKAFAEFTTREIVDGLNVAGIVHEKLANPRDIFEDEQAWENDYLRKITLEDGSEVTLPANPIHFAGMGQTEYKLAPQLGADSVEILKSLGYGDEQIAKFVAKKAIVGKG